jgi:hypothetical protein
MMPKLSFSQISWWVLPVLTVGNSLYAVDAADRLAQTVPPSPSSVTAAALVETFGFAAWPPIVYADERSNVACRIPPEPTAALQVAVPFNANPAAPKQSSGPSTLGWSTGPLATIRLPAEPTGALLPLPGLGTHEAVLNTAAGRHQATLRVAPANQPWPVHHLSGSNAQPPWDSGLPVDAQGIPVVLVDRRRDLTQDRHLGAVTAFARQRPTGAPLVIGDPQASQDQAPLWQAAVKAGATALSATHPRRPSCAILAALGRAQTTWNADPASVPSAIVLMPGPRSETDPQDLMTEERLLGALRSRLDALGLSPRIVVLLPWPPLAQDRAWDAGRGARLRQIAVHLQVIVLDPERIAGPAAEAHRLVPGAYARTPQGAARDALSAALAKACVP